MRDKLLIRYLKARRWYRNLDESDLLTAFLLILLLTNFTLLIVYIGE